MRIRWRRLDVPGWEEAAFHAGPHGCRLVGELQLQEEDTQARLRYTVLCDAAWRTRAVRVAGQVDGRPMRLTLRADGRGRWTQAGQLLPALDGTLDIDLAFTPATNTLPIRRLALAVGESAPVRTAWLRFPGLRLQVLEQTYTREADRAWRYVAQVDGAPFSARLETDAAGHVLSYEGLWQVEGLAAQ